ncbi:monocarboxylate transporter 12-like isoform X2 [Antedon mediterranea]|uniref:monocarboxylate transporter 12-like isoform X2 n=1 Tax=Antedon mediterranea TaxID=105859 RepID=UPI003AF9F510
MAFVNENSNGGFFKKHWSILVLIAVFCNFLCLSGVLFNYNLLYIEIMHSFNSTSTQAGFLMSPGIEWLYETYSWRVAFRILSVILACVGYSSALVMVDVTPKKKKSREKETEQSSRQQTVSIAKYCFLLRRRGYSFGLLAFILTAITITFTFISMGNFLLENGMEISSISFIIFMMGVGDLVGRIVAAIFSDRLPISRIYQHALSSLLTALPTVCLPFIGSHTGQTVVFIVMSLPRSLLIVLMPSIAMELATDNTTSESMAVSYLAFGIGAFTTPYLTDLIYEITGSYDIPWFICTGLYVLAAGFMLLADRARKQNLMTDARQYNLVHKDTIEYKDTQIKTNQIDNRTLTAI